MSAPILTCAMLEAAAPLIKEAQIALGARLHFEYYPPDELGDGSIYCVYIHEHGQCFQGIGDTPTRALLNANGERQDFAEKHATAEAVALADEPLPVGEM